MFEFNYEPRKLSSGDGDWLQSHIEGAVRAAAIRAAGSAGAGMQVKVEQTEGGFRITVHAAKKFQAPKQEGEEGLEATEDADEFIPKEMQSRLTAQLENELSYVLREAVVEALHILKTKDRPR